MTDAPPKDRAMSPSEVAERLAAKAEQHRFAASQSSLGDGSPYNDAAELFEAAASLIRAQSERERVLVEATVHLCAAIDNLWNHPDLARVRSEIPESIKINISRGQLMARAALTKAQP